MDLKAWKLKTYFCELWDADNEPQPDIIEDITLNDLYNISFSWITEKSSYLEAHLEEIKEKYGY